MARPRRFLNWLKSGWFGVLAVGSAVITAGSVVYFNAEELPPFVIEKLPLRLEGVYLLALQIHVMAAAFALPGCLALMSKTVLRRWPSAHRWLGRLVAAVVLLALAPSGLYLSFFAKGGLLGTLGFMLSAAIVGVAVVQGVRTARAGQFLAHRGWMLHVLAQLSVAVTSRAMLFGFAAANFDPRVGYLTALWLPVVASAAAVELFFVSRPTFSFNLRRIHASLAAPGHTAHVHAGLREPAHADS